MACCRQRRGAKKERSCTARRSPAELEEERADKPCRFSRALSLFQEASELDPASAKHLLNAAACLLEMGRPKDCLKLCEEILAMRKEEVGEGLVVRALARKGTAHMR